MGAFDLKGTTTNSWNYSDSSKDNYAEAITGTVIEVSNPQALDFQTKQPKCWPDGNPVRNIRLTILKQNGEEVNWTFQKVQGKMHPNGTMNASMACAMGLDPEGKMSNVSADMLLGKMITVQTKAGSYSAQNPRPWWVTVHGDGDASKVRGVVDLSQQAQPQAAPQPQAPVPPPQPQSYPQQAMAAANGMPQAAQYYGEEVPF